MQYLVRLALLVCVLFLTSAYWSVAQVTGMPPPNAPQESTALPTTAPAIDTTTAPPPTSDRRNWPKPTMDSAHFGLLLFDNVEYQGQGAFRGTSMAGKEVTISGYGSKAKGRNPRAMTATTRPMFSCFTTG